MALDENSVSDWKIISLFQQQNATENMKKEGLSISFEKKN